jgi:broad specificity phosphatase PhoE
MAVKKIYFVRHGETDGNLHEQIVGKDAPLNSRGLLQAEFAASRIKNIDIQKLFVSDFHRAQQTAEPIARATQLQSEINAAFGEILEPTSLFGVSEHDASAIKHKQDRNSNVENPLWRQEDGENLSDIFSRILKAKSILELDSAENILVVSHSFFLQLFTAAVLSDAERASKDWFNLGCHFKISNTGVTLFTVEDGKWRLVMWNDHAHFAE